MVNIIGLEAIGWIASAVFGASYFCKQPQKLRRVQAFAAVLWICYGIVLKAMPIIVSNTIVCGLAIFSSFKKQEINEQ